MSEFRPRFFLAGLCILLALFAFGCGSSNLIAALDVVEVAADQAIPVITAFGPQLGPFADTAIAYSKAVANAAALSITEAGTSDSKNVQYTKIAAYFAAVATLNAPAGVSAEVAAVITAVSEAVQIVLVIVNPTTPQLTAAPPNTLLAKYQAQVKALANDKARVQDALSRAAKVKRQ